MTATYARNATSFLHSKPSATNPPRCTYRVTPSPSRVTSMSDLCVTPILASTTPFSADVHQTLVAICPSAWPSLAQHLLHLTRSGAVIGYAAYQLYSSGESTSSRRLPSAARGGKGVVRSFGGGAVGLREFEVLMLDSQPADWIQKGMNAIAAVRQPQGAATAGPNGHTSAPMQC